MDFKSLMPFGPSGSKSATPARPDYDPFSPFRREMERLFDVMTREFGLPAPFGQNGFVAPKMNVAETEKGLEVSAELPGVDQKEIELSLENGVLTIKAEHTSEKEEKDEAKQYYLVERSQGTYMRRIAIPFEAEEDKVEASFDKGVLKVLVPRSAKAAASVKKIAIKGG